MTKSQVVERYGGNTVSKLTSEKRLDHLGPNNPSLGMRYIYHQTDGQAVYSKRTDKGYARREAGRWWAGDDKICYSMRVTRAEDPEGDRCAPAGTDAAWSTFERGDTQSLGKPVRTARGGNSDIGFGYDKVLALAGAALVVGGGIAKASDAVCGPGGCPTAQSTAATAAPGQTQAAAPAAGPSVKSYSCTVYCNPGDRELRLPVQATSEYKAELSLKNQSLHKICTGAGYSGVGGGFLGDGINCR